MLTALALALIILGFFGTILPLLPGAPVSFVGLLLWGWADNFVHIGWWSLAIAGVLTLIGQILDFVATHYGVKRAGASTWGLAGAMLGIVAGVFFVPFGIILGPMIGAILGELINQKLLWDAGKVGVVAGVSIIISMAMKLILLAIAVTIVVIDYFY